MNVRLVYAAVIPFPGEFPNIYGADFYIVVAESTEPKEVTVRLAFSDEWSSYIDIPAQYLRSVRNGEELWSAEFRYPDGQTERDYSYRFAIWYSSGEQTYWDNNGGWNYALGASPAGMYFEVGSKDELEVLLA